MKGYVRNNTLKSKKKYNKTTKVKVLIFFHIEIRIFLFQNAINTFITYTMIIGT